MREAVPTTFLAMEGRLESASSISTLISGAERGDRVAAETLFSTFYGELHRLAKRELARRGVPVSLSATTLLHQAYIEIAEQDRGSFADRARFMGYAARVMRGVIIDHARNRRAQKRGGQFQITSLGSEIEDAANPSGLIQIGEALDELSKTDPLLSKVVDLEFFCGFTFAEIGAMKGISERTIQRQWEKARIFLHRKIRADLN